MWLTGKEILWSSLVEGLQVSAQVVSCCDYDKPKNVCSLMYGNIPFMFECCANPGLHLQLLRSSMGRQIILCYNNVIKRFLEEIQIPQN